MAGGLGMGGGRRRRDQGDSAGRFAFFTRLSHRIAVPLGRPLHAFATLPEPSSSRLPLPDPHARRRRQAIPTQMKRPSTHPHPDETGAPTAGASSASVTEIRPLFERPGRCATGKVRTGTRHVSSSRGCEKIGFTLRGMPSSPAPPASVVVLQVRRLPPDEPDCRGWAAVGSLALEHGAAD